MADGNGHERPSLHQLCRTGEDEVLSQVLEQWEDKSLVLTSPDEEGLHPLHTALLNANPACVQVLLEAGSDPNFPYDGNPPVVLAVALGQFADYRSDCLDQLKSLLGCEGVDVNAQDRLGRSALHVTVASDWTEASELLLASQINWNLRTHAGRLALHEAVEHNSVNCVKMLLRQDAEMASDSTGDYPVHVAVRNAAWDSLAVLLETTNREQMLKDLNGSRQTPSSLAEACGYINEYQACLAGSPASSPRRTLIVTHDICNYHAALPLNYRTPSSLSKQRKLQAENPTRLQILQQAPNGALLVDEFVDNLLWVWTPAPAGMGDILRVHDYSYVDKISGLSAAVEEDRLPFKYDRDTWVSKQSFSAALHAAGAVIAAVDEVVNGSYRNAFCCIRPPGHHIGVYGAVESETEPDLSSSGFCLLNNVAIGASYAMCIRRAQINRVAIVDFDVHHGNGTEEIVRNLQPSQRIMRQQAFGWKSIIETTSYKPWLDTSDPQNVLFVSSHGYGSGFYPASGGKNADEHYPAGILNIPFPQGTDSQAFRTAYRTQVFPRILAFQPDLIFISAGFDGHELDAINHGFVHLDEEDFRWVTEELVKVANTCCEGRVISVLEGGYRTKGGLVSALAQSVAAHVRALMMSNRQNYADPASCLLEDEERRMRLKRRVEEDSSRRVLRKRQRREGATQELLDSPESQDSQ